MLRHLVGHGTPSRCSVGQPLGELEGLFADDDPSNMVADDREAEQVAQLSLQLLGREVLVALLDYDVLPSTEEIREHDGIVVLRIAGSVDEGECAVVRPRAQLLEFRLFRFEFDSVPAAELGEAGWVMAEPLPQLALGASSRAHSSRRRCSCETPRGQSRSMSTR